MKKTHRNRNYMKKKESASTSPEETEQKTKKFYFASKAMQAPEPFLLPPPSFFDGNM